MTRQDPVGIERFGLFGKALAGRLARLRAETDADAYEAIPFDAEDAALDESDDWGPAAVEAHARPGPARRGAAR